MYNKGLEENGSKIMLYPPTQSFEELREKIKINDIQIINGFQLRLDLVLKTLSLKPKNKIIGGNPTYHGALNIFKANCKIY